jgi:hypothetical protein
VALESCAFIIVRMKVAHRSALQARRRLATEFTGQLRSIENETLAAHVHRAALEALAAKTKMVRLDGRPFCLQNDQMEIDGDLIFRFRLTAIPQLSIWKVISPILSRERAPAICVSM